jgi:GxxExxY protein
VDGEEDFVHECTRIGTNEEENICVLLIAVHRGFIACGGITFSLCDEHSGKIREDSCELVDGKECFVHECTRIGTNEEERCMHGEHELLYGEHELLYKDEVYSIIGAAFEVYNTLGPGFLEAVYQEALGLELKERGIPFQAEQRIRVTYKGRPLEKEYQADMVCYGVIILEVKALSRLATDHEAQLINYLKAGGMRVGVLMNFGNVKKLEWKRMVV